jgi:hypothetical protein
MIAFDSPLRPRLQKGALVAYESDLIAGIPNIIMFQYNPEQLSRTLTSQRAGEKPEKAGYAREEILKVAGPPLESITLKVILDATDQLEHPFLNPQVIEFGLHPALAALELLLYPPPQKVQQAEQLADDASAQMSDDSQAVPLVLFVWGPHRVLPVQVTSFSVTEEFFDPNLNPIRASVDLGLHVITYLASEVGTLAHSVALANLEFKDRMAQLSLANTAEQALTVLLPF